MASVHPGSGGKLQEYLDYWSRPKGDLSLIVELIKQGQITDYPKLGEPIRFYYEEYQLLDKRRFHPEGGIPMGEILALGYPRSEARHLARLFDQWDRVQKKVMERLGEEKKAGAALQEKLEESRERSRQSGRNRPRAGYRRSK